MRKLSRTPITIAARHVVHVGGYEHHGDAVKLGDFIKRGVLARRHSLPSRNYV